MGGREIEGVVEGDDDVGQLKGADRGRREGAGGGGLLKSVTCSL